MHDAGGDRGQTVAALDRYIPQMRRQGFRFVTVTQALRTALAAPNSSQHSAGVVAPASTGLSWRGRAMVWTVQVARHGLVAVTVALLIAGVLTIARSVLLFAAAWRHVRRRRGRLTRSTWPPRAGRLRARCTEAARRRAGWST